MVWETLGSALIGLALAWAAVHRMPSRLPAHRVVLPTGAGGGLVGGLLGYAVTGPGHLVVALVAAAAVSAAALSLLCSARTAPQPAVPRRTTASARPH